jgi:hypothetical protein
MVMRDQFYEELLRILQQAAKEGRENVDVNAGELHSRVGGYPGRDHRMPVCCSVMRFEFSEDRDRVLEAPPGGDGASLTIRYGLPRNVEFSRRQTEGEMVATNGIETADVNPIPYEAVVRQMMTREDELTNQRMLWMAAFNGLLFAALGFAWNKQGGRFLTMVFCTLGFFASFLNGLALILASNAQRSLLLWWHKKRPTDYDGPGVMGSEPLDNQRLYSMYFAPWIWLAFIFSGGWLLILRFICKYVT